MSCVAVSTTTDKYPFPFAVWRLVLLYLRTISLRINTYSGAFFPLVCVTIPMENILSHDKDDNYIDDDESDADFLMPVSYTHLTLPTN